MTSGDHATQGREVMNSAEGRKCIFSLILSLHANNMSIDKVKSVKITVKIDQADYPPSWQLLWVNCPDRLSRQISDKQNKPKGLHC